jgi:hypothetical protein
MERPGLLERGLPGLEQLAEAAALEHLGDQVPAGAQRLAPDLEGPRGQLLAVELIAVAVARGVRRHVREHDVDAAEVAGDQVITSATSWCT